MTQDHNPEDYELPEDYQSFVDKVQEALSLIEDFGGWTKEYQKIWYGGKRNNDTPLNRIREKMNELDLEPTEELFIELWKATATECDYFEQLRDELQEKHDNTPESLQDTDAYWNRDEAIQILDQVVNDVEEAVWDFNDKPWAKVAEATPKASEGIWERVARRLKDADKQYDLGIINTAEWKALKKEIASEIPDNEPFPKDFNK